MAMISGFTLLDMTISNFIKSERLWVALEEQLFIHNRDVFDSLRPPATDTMIRWVEKEMNLVFPADVRDAYLRHDGSEFQSDWGMRQPKLIGRASRWLPLEEVLETWKMHKEIVEDGGAFDAQAHYLENLDQFRSEKVRPGPLLEWIPIGNDGAGGYVCIDLVPAPAGNVGQLVELDYGWGCDFLSPSFNDYMSWLVTGLVAGTAGWKDGLIYM